MGKLTALKVEKAKYPAGLTAQGKPRTSPVRLGDGGGLYLVIKPSGAKSWALLVQHNGRRREVGLGGYPADLDLGEAREKAAQLRKLARQGRNPMAERDKAKVVTPTFAEAVDKAHKALGSGWADKTAEQFKASLDAHTKSLANKLVDEIESEHVIAALAPIWTEKPQMARKVRHRILQVLSFARSHGWRSSAVPTADELRRGLSKQPRSKGFAAVPYAEVAAFVAGEIGKVDTPARLALLFTILTAARSGEVRKARWEQIDRDAREWNRPAEIMKAGVAHTVTLNDAALAVLDRARALSGADGLIFPGFRGNVLSDPALTKMLRNAGRSETVHGFRSSFRDWAAEQMPTMPPMVAEMALAHSVGTLTEKAYLRSDMRELRRTLMEAWGRFVAPSLSGSTDNVVPLGAAKRSA
jgi:integrase